MGTDQMNWKTRDRWGWREFILLMLLEFIIVIGVVKLIVQPFYAEWLKDDLYAGTLTGLTIAVILMAGVYFIALRPKRLSWREAGVKAFSSKD